MDPLLSKEKQRTPGGSLEERFLGFIGKDEEGAQRGYYTNVSTLCIED